MTQVLFEHTAWFVYIYGVYGNTGHKKEGRKRGEFPCHGSMYSMLNGKAFAGPASLQAPPSNVLPYLHLETDNDGDLWIKPAVWDVNENGIVGYGRFLKK